MNERIKLLLAKAHLDVMEDLGDIDTNHVAERFAQLIIEECAQQCWTVSELESKGFVVSECTKRMRKHFGVE
jgi:hypothetical protein